jgi:hypothetical protein
MSRLFDLDILKVDEESVRFLEKCKCKICQKIVEAMSRRLSGDPKYKRKVLIEMP